MKKCLVIGGQGYIGSALMLRLKASGYMAVLADIKSGIDYRDMHSEVIQTFDAVIWLAGHSSVGQAKADPVGAIDNNLTGLIALARKLKSTQQFLYASSASVHDETAARNVYDATKRAAEEVIPFLHHNTWALRFGTVAGPSPVMRLDTMINAMTHTAVTKSEVHMSNHSARRPILGISDLCDGIERILSGQIEPGCINMCSFNTTVWDVANYISKRFSTGIITHEGSLTYDFIMPVMPKCKQTLKSIVDDLTDLFAQEENKDVA